MIIFTQFEYLCSYPIIPLRKQYKIQRVNRFSIFYFPKIKKMDGTPPPFNKNVNISNSLYICEFKFGISNRLDHTHYISKKIRILRYMLYKSLKSGVIWHVLTHITLRCIKGCRFINMYKFNPAFIVCTKKIVE